MAKFVGDELTEINSIASIYDTMIPTIKEKVKQPSTFARFLKLFREFATKNDSRLNTNIMGRQIILNSRLEDDIIETFGFERNDIKELITESPYFKKFGKELALTDQLCLAIPLILASLEYRRINKKEESELCYLFAFFKPYASRESVFFKYGVNEAQMLYTIENDLTDRYDLKVNKTVFLCIKKKAENSYNNYITEYKPTQKMTDSELHIIYNSGIASRMNQFIGKVVELYKKNTGKSLDFESAAVEVLDKDADSTDYEDADIQSDIAIKNTVVNRTINKVTKDPVDKKLILIACQSVYGTAAKSYIDIMYALIEEITDKMFDDLTPFFSALIGSFLFHTDPITKKVYTMADFKTPVFLNVGSDILAGRKSHLKDKNMVIARDIFAKMIQLHLDRVGKTFGETYMRNMRKALANYWVYVIKSAN